MKAEEAKRLKELEEENKRLKKLLAEAELDKAILKEALRGKLLSPARRRRRSRTCRVGLGVSRASGVSGAWVSRAARSGIAPCEDEEEQRLVARAVGVGA